MLTIRQQQIDSLCAARSRHTPEKVTRYIRKRAPEALQGWSRERLADFVRAAIERAGLYGITIEWDVARFVYFELRFGPKFDLACDWAGRILQDTAREPTIRVDRLERYYRNYLETEPLQHDQGL